MPASKCLMALLFLFNPDCIFIMLLGMTKSFQLCLLRSFSALLGPMIVASEAEVVMPEVEVFRKSEVGAEAGASRISGVWSKLSSSSTLLDSDSSRLSSSCDNSILSIRRPGFDGEPNTGSRNVLGDDSLLEVGVPPNMSPPDSLLPCFLDIEPIRRMVLAVDMAKLGPRGEVAEEGGGVSDEEDRLPTMLVGFEPEGP
jgi:hypothetical protein